MANNRQTESQKKNRKPGRTPKVVPWRAQKHRGMCIPTLNPTYIPYTKSKHLINSFKYSIGNKLGTVAYWIWCGKDFVNMKILPTEIIQHDKYQEKDLIVNRASETHEMMPTNRLAVERQRENHESREGKGKQSIQTASHMTPTLALWKARTASPIQCAGELLLSTWHDLESPGKRTGKWGIVIFPVAVSVRSHLRWWVVEGPSLLWTIHP